MSEVDLSEMKSDMIGVTKECTLTLMASGDNYGQRVLSGAGRQARERNYKGMSKSRVKGGGNERANGRADICINPSLSLCVLPNDNRLMRVS